MKIITIISLILAILCWIPFFTSKMDGTSFNKGAALLLYFLMYPAIVFTVISLILLIFLGFGS